MNYDEISKDTILNLYKSYESLNKSPLDQQLRAMIELRVSQLNRCSYCCQLHTEEAQKLGVEPIKIDQLPQWKDSALFSDAEKEVLAWSESLTTLSDTPTIKKTNLSNYFSEREIVDITVCIAIMNAFNRINSSLRD
ncbi:MAG: carboxymuconolactone decarboxylase family protein [Alphaproteobacteria bacterium]|nr:carboxymuconolactone decarboxylase family protein [Alphaproteobacteria bacterium]